MTTVREELMRHVTRSQLSSFYTDRIGWVTPEMYGAKGDGVTIDSAAFENMIDDAINNNLFIYVLPKTYNLGTNTLTFPNTMPAGFTFYCNPATKFTYSGNGDAVLIDSNYLANITFGKIVGSGGSASCGIHFKPAGLGPSNQLTMVVSRFFVNEIAGFQKDVYFDCLTGSIAQCQFTFNNLMCGNGNGQVTANAYGMIVDGASPYIFQGNRIDVGYLLSGQPYDFAAGVSWLGLKVGSATFAEVLVNVNVWNINAIDGFNNPLTSGIETYAGEDTYTGNIVDMTANDVVLQQDAKANQFIMGALGGTIVNNSSNFSNFIRGNRPIFNSIQFGMSGNLIAYQSGDNLSLWRKTAGAAMSILNPAGDQILITLATDGSCTGEIYKFNNGRLIYTYSGSPEGVLTAPIGSMYLRTDGGAGTTLYIKESGAGNTGWVAK